MKLREGMAQKTRIFSELLAEENSLSGGNSRRNVKHTILKKGKGENHFYPRVYENDCRAWFKGTYGRGDSTLHGLS